MQHAVQRGQPRRRRAAPCARSSSAASGFFFCGMIEEPDAHASDTSQKPNSSRDHRTISAPSRERCVAQVAAAARKSSTKSRLETASIEFGDDAGEAELARRPARGRSSKFTPASAPAPSGSSVGRAEHELEAARVAPEHPEVREQVVREVDRLGALEVRVAGHRPVQVALGELHEHALEVLRACSSVSQRVRAREHRHVGGDLVVARARGVQLAADRADDLGQPPLDRHVDVLVVVARTGTRPSSSSASTRVEPAEQRVAVGVADDPGRGEHRRVRARLLDVVGPEPPVEADRGVQLAEDRVLWLREARHPAIMPAMEVVVRPARPRTPRDGLLYALGRAVLRRLRRRRRARAAAAAPRSTRAAGTPRAGRSAASPRRAARSSGVLAAFPSATGDALARRFVRLTLTALAAVAAAAR